MKVNEYKGLLIINACFIFVFIFQFELEFYSKHSNRLNFEYLEDLNRICLRESAESSLDVLRQWLPGESEEFYRKVIKWCPQRITKLADLTKEFPYLSKNFKPPECDEDEARLLSFVLETVSKLSGTSVMPTSRKYQPDIRYASRLLCVFSESLCGVEVRLISTLFLHYPISVSLFQ